MTDDEIFADNALFGDEAGLDEKGCDVRLDAVAGSLMALHSVPFNRSSHASTISTENVCAKNVCAENVHCDESDGDFDEENDACRSDAGASAQNHRDTDDDVSDTSSWEEPADEKESRHGNKRKREEEHQDLSEYELKRLRTMDTNREHLVALGLVEKLTKFQTPIEKKKRPKRAEKNIPEAASRFSDRRKKNIVVNYFEANEKLEDCEKRLTKKRKGSDEPRQRKASTFYNGEDYEQKAKVRKSKVRSESVSTTMSTHGSAANDEPKKSLNGTTVPLLMERLFNFDFITQQLIDADADPDYVNKYRNYCADRANVRHHNLLNKYSADDVNAVALCVECDDTFIDVFGDDLVQDYKNERDSFKCNDFVLASFNTNKYIGANPRVVCPMCKGEYALKWNGKIRSHAGCSYSS